MRDFFFIGVVLVYLLPGCTANVYVPTAHHTPLLEKKGDLHTAAFTGTKGSDFHAAYAFTNRIGLGATASFYSENFDDTQDFQDHRYGELSLIYSIPAEEDIVRAELLAGIGLGEGKAFNEYAPYSLNPLYSPGLVSLNILF